MELVAAASFEVPIRCGDQGMRPLTMTRLSRSLALMLAGRLDRRDCERVVLAAYPGLARCAHAANPYSPGSWLRSTVERRERGLIEDLACEALRAAGLPVEIDGLGEIRAAGERLAEIEASGGSISGRAALARVAYPTRHPGLRFTSFGAVRQSVCVVRRAVCLRQQGRAARPGHVRRRRSSARAPDDPGEPEPGEVTRRAAEDHVALHLSLGVSV